MFHMTAPWHHSKHPGKHLLSCHNWFVMLSRQLCDITMDWWRCHWYQTIMLQTAWILYTRSRKTWIFYIRSRWWENMDISTQKLNLGTYHRIKIVLYCSVQNILLLVCGRLLHLYDITVGMGTIYHKTSL